MNKCKSASDSEKALEHISDWHKEPREWCNSSTFAEKSVYGKCIKIVHCRNYDQYTIRLEDGTKEVIFI